MPRHRRAGTAKRAPSSQRDNRLATGVRARRIERFIRTMLGGWAHGAIYASSKERTAALDGWLWHDNHRRRYHALGRQTPITRLNNLLGTYS
jgi:hypothetical protein